MTPAQKARRAVLEVTLGRPDPKAVEHDVAELLEVVCRQVPPAHRLELRSDEHRTYPRSIRRLGIHLVWRNYVKKQRENASTPATAAMTVGAARAPLSFARILRRRRFPEHCALPPRWHRYYERRVRTAAYHRQSRHALRYAY